MEINIEKIKSIAKSAGEAILKYYNQENFLYFKEKNSPLTEADLASENILNKQLSKYSIPILSEESEDSPDRLKSENIWIIDPLDGTSDFIQKTDDFSILISLVKNKQPILAVIYLPVTKEFFWAEKNKGSFHEINGKVSRNKVSPLRNFKELTILTSRNHLSKVEEKFGYKLKKIIPMGSAGIKMARIASGHGDIYLNSSNKTSEWDTCAGKLILEEAGGKITDLEGNEIYYNQKNPSHLKGFLCSNNKIHQKIIDQLKDIK